MPTTPSARGGRRPFRSPDSPDGGRVLDIRKCDASSCSTDGPSGIENHHVNPANKSQRRPESCGKTSDGRIPEFFLGGWEKKDGLHMK